MMLERTVGMPTAKWVEDQLLGDVQIENQAILGTDRNGYFHGANGVVRLSLIDWIRFAVYVDSQRRADTCFGRFIKDMGTTQIRASGVTKGFDGYGFLTWTDNSYAPNTFWAVGYGGQRIGWSSDPNNGRIILLFSNSADRDMDLVYSLAHEWFSLGHKN
jgi:CubicO group peptidase (beta-lactamase class C family)